MCSFLSPFVFMFLSFRAHLHGSPSPTGTPSSGRRGRQLPQLPAKSSSIEQGTLHAWMWVCQKRTDAMKRRMMVILSKKNDNTVFRFQSTDVRQGCYSFGQTLFPTPHKHHQPDEFREVWDTKLKTKATTSFSLLVMRPWVMYIISLSGM